MIITRLQAENFKKIRAVEIVPGEGSSLVPILGRNGQGKSSVLDAITAALAGKAYLPEEPVRLGEEEGAVRLELDGGKIIVRRIFDREGGGSIVVENADGARYPSPQAVLDRLYSSVSFDPIAFTRLGPKEQLEQLRRLVKLDVDVDRLVADNKADYDARRDKNREIATWEGQLAGFADVPAEPLEPIDTAEIERAIADASRHNGEIEQRKVRREQASEQVRIHRNQAAQHDRTVESIERQIAELQAQAEEHRKISAAENEAAEKIEKQLAEAVALPEPIDVSAVTQQLTEAQAHNRRAERQTEKRALQARVDRLKEESEALTTRMKEREARRVKAFADAKMPVPGLSFGDDKVLFNDLPLAQASTAEQLRISTAIGMAMAPELRVMLVRDASLLDDEGFALLASMAVDGGFQFWVESVDTSGKVGIVMEDGAVKDAPPPEPIDKGKRRPKKPAEESAAEGAGEAVSPATSDRAAGAADVPAAEAAPAPPPKPKKQPQPAQSLFD